MKNIALCISAFVFFIFAGKPFPAFSHVVPEDELRNQVYLSDREALTQVFQGIHKIKKETRKTSSIQINRIEQLIGRKVKESKMVVYSGGTGEDRVYAVFGKAHANSHPVTVAKFILLIDSRGAIKDIRIMEYKGPQRAEIISSQYLSQYLDKTADSDFTSITSNQGPTPSSQALVQAVRQWAITLKILFLDS